MPLFRRRPDQPPLSHDPNATQPDLPLPPALDQPLPDRAFNPPPPEAALPGHPPTPPPRLDPSYKPVVVGPDDGPRPRVAPEPPSYQAPNADASISHQIDWLIQHQPVRHRFNPSPEDVGRRVSDLYPHRFAPDEDLDQQLNDLVERVGRNHPERYIHLFNPNFEPGFGAYSTNCADAMRAYATVRLTGSGYAAAGDRAFSELDLTPWWAGVTPQHTIYAQSLADLGPFQQRAWDYLASHITGGPRGRVGIVVVTWEPVVVKGTAQAGAVHALGIELGMDDKVKWVDPQSGTYQDWPPQYPNRIVSANLIYCDPTELVWRSGGPGDLWSQAPYHTRAQPYPSTPVLDFSGETLATHEGLPSWVSAHRGNTLRDHTGLSDQQLRMYLDQNPRQPFHSTFSDWTSADHWVDDVIRRYRADVDTWLRQTGEPRLVLHHNYGPGFETGRILRPGAPHSDWANGVAVTLERRPPGVWPAYTIVNAHPTDPLVPAPPPPRPTGSPPGPSDVSPPRPPVAPPPPPPGPPPVAPHVQPGPPRTQPAPHDTAAEPSAAADAPGGPAGATGADDAGLPDPSAHAAATEAPYGGIVAKPLLSSVTAASDAASAAAHTLTP
ncbi:MAG TPA: RNase A-like domain-containing protein, partial [Acidimicrobiales bacterium]